MPYVYFVGLTKENLPVKSQELSGYDIVTWYLNWSGRKRNIGEIRHSVLGVANGKIDDLDIVFQRSQFPSSMTILNLLKYVNWALASILIATFDCLRGRWWHALILN